MKYAHIKSTPENELAWITQALANEAAVANQLKKLELIILNDSSGMWGNALFKEMVGGIN